MKCNVMRCRLATWRRCNQQQMSAFHDLARDKRFNDASLLLTSPAVTTDVYAWSTWEVAPYTGKSRGFCSSCFAFACPSLID
eukprot:335207-Chlamydomonas_euryale.AAC.1